MARKSKKDQLAEQALTYLQKAIHDNTDIVNNAESNLEAYRRDPYGNEVDGRSEFVASDVADTIEWIMPYLMKLFYGGNEVVTIQPTGKGADEKKAKLMNAKINYDFMQRQKGFILLHDWVKASLMQPLSTVKYCWQRDTIKDYKEYEGLDQEEMQAIIETTQGIDEKTIETEYDDEEGTYNLSFVTKEKIEYPKTIIIPPEEFVHSIRSKIDMTEADFAAHKRRVHKNYLKSRYKLREKDIEAVAQEFEDGTTLEETRYEDLGGIYFVTDDVESDFYYIYECYMNDYDEGGEKVPKKVTIFGNKVIELEDNSYGRPPFCTLTSVRIPYRIAGMSVADLVYDLQKLHTSLIRAIMDNVYYQNNAVNIVNPYRVNLDDVLTRKEPGAVWRTLDDIDPNTAVAPVPSSPVAQHTMQLLEYIETMREKRSGVSNATTGLDPNTLNNNKSGAVGSIMSAAQQKIELLARIMAETGLTDHFEQYVKMNLDYMTQKQAIKVDEEWAEITPNNIQGSYDVLVDVGIGTAAKEVQLNQLITLIQTAYPLALQLGVVTSEDYYNTLTTVYELMGYKNTDKFATNPGQDPQMQQIHQQYEQTIQQLQQAVQALQSELQKAQMDKEVDLRELAIKEREVEIKELDVKLDAMIREKLGELKYDVDKEKNANDIAKGVINAQQRGSNRTNASS